MPTIKELEQRRGKALPGSGLVGSTKAEAAAFDKAVADGTAKIPKPSKGQDRTGLVGADGKTPSVLRNDPNLKALSAKEKAQANLTGVGSQEQEAMRGPATTQEGGGLLGQAEQATQAFEQLREQTKGLGEAYQTAIETLTGILGEQKDFFAKQMDVIQNQTGMLVDVAAPGFQEAIGAATEAAEAAGEVDFTKTLEQFLVPEDQVKQTEDVEALKQQALQSGVPQERIEEAEKEVETGEPFFNQQDFVEFLKQGIKAAGAELAAPAKPTTLTDPAEVASQIPTEHAASGTKNQIIEEAPVEDKIDAALDNVASMAPGDLEASIGGIVMDMSQATSGEMLLAAITQQKLQAIDSPLMSQYFSLMEQRAQDAYMSSVDEGRKSISDISKAISGEDFVPTTYEGVAAKAYADAKKFGLENIEAERTYIQEQKNIWMKQESEKRGRLEGYLKGKLYAMGAQDSSAGLSLMAAQINATDLRLQAQENEYNYALSKLNIGAREVMTNFTNNVVKLTMDTEKKKAEAASEYEDKLFEITGLRIEDEQEKRQLKLNAMSEYQEKSYKMEQDQKAEERWQYEQSYKQVRDLIKDANDLSGMTGTIYAVDKDGNLVDTGVPTFESKKWESTNWLNTKKFEHTLSNDGWNKAMDLIELGGADAIASAEILAGMPEGSLASLGSAMERKQALSDYMEGGQISKELLFEIAGENGVISSMYGDNAWGGQCGAFIHNFVTDYPYNLNTLSQKMGVINSQTPQVGSVVILDESFPGTNSGHVAIINKITEDGRLVLTESNYGGNERVTNTRTINPDYSKIRGYFNGTLSPKIEGAFKSLAESKLEPYEQRVRDGVPIDQVKKDIEKEIKDTELRSRVMSQFNSLIYDKKTVRFSKEDVAGLGPYGRVFAGKDFLLPSLYERAQVEEEEEEEDRL